MKDISFLKSNLIAHRGLHDSNTLENTLNSFVKAMDKGYIIELDVHILSDKTIVVYHDFNLKRLTGVNKIIETLDYRQLSRIRIKRKYQIPTLNQVLNLVKSKVPIIIEIKDLNENIEFYELLSNMLKNYNLKFAIQAMNPKVIDWFYKNKPQYVLGLILFNNLNYKIFKKITKKVDFLAVNKKSLPFKSKKMIIGWTIKNEIEHSKYGLLADNLICENILK